MIYKLCSKTIPTQAVFTMIEMNNEWNINFLQNSSLWIPQISIGWRISESTVPI